MHDPPLPDRYSVIHPVQASKFGPWLADFWAAHPDWRMATATTDVIYTLPPAVIDFLATAAPGRRPLFDARQAGAERAFADLCSGFFAVGATRTAFVTGTPLDPRPARAPAAGWGDLLDRFAWAPGAVAALDGERDRLDGAAERMKGYVGWLLTEPAFLAEVAALRSIWSALPPGFRPDPPLHRPTWLPPDAEAVPGEPRFFAAPAGEFAGALTALLDKWDLCRLAAWDLPVPQGPLVPNPLPHGSPASPRTGVNVHVPVYYPLTGEDDLTTRVQRIQQQAARDLGIDPSAAGLPRHGAYAQMLDVLHIERAVRARFVGRAPVGLVSRLTSVIAEHLGIDADRVRKYRQAIARCHRGDRARVPILRVTPTAHRV